MPRPWWKRPAEDPDGRSVDGGTDEAGAVRSRGGGADSSDGGSGGPIGGYGFPQRIEIVEGKLYARVYAHDVGSLDGPVPCWTYVSEGLMRRGQQEILFTLARGTDVDVHDPPPDPIRFFATIFDVSRPGEGIGAGGYTQLKGPMFMGHRSFIYAPARDLAGVTLTAPTIAAFVVKDEEFELRMKFGPMRLLANLARAYRAFPWPLFSDPSRAVLPVAEKVASTILARLPVAHTPGITVCREEERVVMRLPGSAGPGLSSMTRGLPSGSPFALLPDWEPLADGCLAWQPGQEQPEAIGPEGSEGRRIAACFIAFVDDEEPGRVGVVEDGAFVRLSSERRRELLSCWEEGAPFALPGAGDEPGFALEWLQQDYHNPVDGNVYSSPDGWRTFAPQKLASESASGPVESTGAIMLSAEWEIEAYVGVEELSVFVRNVDAVVSRHFEEHPEVSGQDLLLQLVLGSGVSVESSAASRPGIPAPVLAGLHEQLAGVATPTTRGGPLVFQLVMAIRGGSGAPWSWAGGGQGSRTEDPNHGGGGSKGNGGDGADGGREFDRPGPPWVPED